MDSSGKSNAVTSADRERSAAAASNASPSSSDAGASTTGSLSKRSRAAFKAKRSDNFGLVFRDSEKYRGNISTITDRVSSSSSNGQIEILRRYCSCKYNKTRMPEIEDGPTC